MFDVSSVTISYHTVDLLPVLILGVFGGIFGGLFNYLLDKTLRVYSLINERGPLFKLILTGIVSIITSCCSFGLPWLAKCIPCPEGLDESCPTIGRSGNFKKFQCPPGHYNDLASLFFNTNDDAIRNLFSYGTATEFHTSSILMFFVAVFVLALLTYGIAVPSGLFIPVILAGATYGRFVGILIGSFTELDQGLFAVLGAASFLGGSMRMTVSLCVILLELTNNLLMLPLVMLVLLISKTVGDMFNSSVYDQIVHLKGLPFLEANAEPFMRHLFSGDVVRGPLVTFSGIEKVGHILQVLKSCSHNGFPVIDEPPLSEAPVLCGLVLRSHLLVLLMRRKFLATKTFANEDFIQHFSSVDFAKAGSGKGITVKEIQLTAEEEEMFIDLHPFTNTSPYTVVETMSLAKAMILFRQLGLRHLCVVPKSSGRPPIVGILTRHDFMAEHILGLFPNLKQSKWKRLRLRLSIFTTIAKKLPIISKYF
uniref:Chloride channel protein n=1 Tax=Araucaria cunninghamii TaxID=56994 RepID=A0A0D6QRU6_ARACU